MKKSVKILIALFIFSGMLRAQSGWVTQYNAPTEGFTCIQFIDENTGYALSFYQKLLKTTNGGNTWQTIDLLPIGGNEQTLFFVNSLTGWIGTVNGNGGKIAKTTDGGMNWILQITGLAFVYDVKFANTLTGYASGNQGLVIKTTNGGTNWSSVSPGPEDFSGMEALNASTVYVCGANSKIYFTSNGGINWITRNSGGTQFRDIKFANPLTGYVVGGECKKTTNGGVNWVTMDGGLNNVQSIAVYSPEILWAVGNTIKTSYNGGLSWGTQDSLTFISSISFVNFHTGWVCGSNGVIKKTTTGGWGIPAAPTNLSATPASTYRVNLSWTGNPNNTLRYKIERSTNNVNFVLIDSVPVGTTVYSDSSLTGATTYYYRVYCSNPFANGGYTNVASALTYPGLPELVYPPNNSAGISLTPTLSWNGIPGVTSYKVQVSSDPTFTVTIVNDNTGNAFYYIPPAVLQNNVIYYWRINATNTSGTGPWSQIWNFRTGLVGIQPINNEIPKQFKMYNNYPNPFNPATKIKFDIPKEAFVNITAFDITGKQIDVLVNENLNAGRYEADFNGAKLSSGVYFYRITAGEFTDLKKMILVK